MEVVIDNQSYKLHFGVRFVEELDKKSSLDAGPIKFGTGVTSIYAKLHSPNPYPMYEALHAALITQIDLTEDQFDVWVDSFKTDKQYENFFDKFIKELKNARQTKFLIRNYEQQMQELTKEAETAEKETPKQSTQK